MDTLRHLDDQIRIDVTGFARPTGGLHGVVLGHATYRLVLFALVLFALALLAALQESSLSRAASAA